MELAAELRRALDGLCAVGAPEVRENGEWLAGLEGAQYEVSAQGDATLLHLWSAQQSLVRRVLRVAEESGGRVTDFAGNRFTLDSHETLASDGLIHDEMVALFNDMFAGRNPSPIPTPQEFAARRAARAVES